MLRNRLHTAAAVAVLLAGAQFAQAQAKVQVQTQQPIAGPHHTLRAKSIMGAQISIQGSNSVGTIQDIILNDDGVVEYFVVGDGTKNFTVPWEAAKFNFENRTAVININQEQFRQIPTYTVNQYPDFYAPAYRTQVYRYYGITPGRERRLERREERRP